MPCTASTRSVRTPAIASVVSCVCGGGDGGGVGWTGAGGRPWPGAVPGAGRVGAESDAVEPAESEAVTPGAEAAAVEELASAAVVAAVAELEVAKTWSKPGYLIPNW